MRLAVEQRLHEDLRHESVHYPKVGDSEIRDLLRQLGHVDARVTARPDGELVAEWTTMTTALRSLGVQPGSLDWLRGSSQPSVFGGGSSSPASDRLFRRGRAVESDELP